MGVADRKCRTMWPAARNLLVVLAAASTVLAGVCPGPKQSGVSISARAGDRCDDHRDACPSTLADESPEDESEHVGGGCSLFVVSRTPFRVVAGRSILEPEDRHATPRWRRPAVPIRGPPLAT